MILFDQVAVKVLEKDKIKEGDSLERVNREINLLKNLKNDNVIQLYEVNDSNPENRG